MSEKESKKPCPYCGNWFKNIEKHKQKCKMKEVSHNQRQFQENLYKGVWGVNEIIKNDADVWFDNMCESDCDKMETGGDVENLEYRMATLFYLKDIRNALFKLLELKDDKK